MHVPTRSASVVLSLAIDGVPGGEATFQVLGPGGKGRTIYALVRAVINGTAYEIGPSVVDTATGKLIPCRADVRIERKGTIAELIDSGLGAGYVEHTKLMPGKIVYVRAEGEQTLRYALNDPCPVLPPLPVLTDPVQVPLRVPLAVSLSGRPDIPAFPLLIEADAQGGLAVFMRRRRLRAAAA